MGIGDQVMAAGRAKLLHRKTGKKVAIGRPNQILWCELYDNNPYLVSPTDNLPDDEFVELLDYPGHRPYIDYEGTLLHADNRRLKGIKNCQRWVWNYRNGPPEPAEVFLSMEECWQAGRYMTKDFVIVDPHIKVKAPPHKKWYFSHFQEVVDAIRGYVEVIQPTYGSGPILDGVTPRRTSVREIAVWMSEAKCVITNEGLLHHLAAAFSTPAVVIAGAFITKDVTGYQYQTWFQKHDKRVIGMRAESPAGFEVMKDIKPLEVIRAVKRILMEGK